MALKHGALRRTRCGNVSADLERCCWTVMTFSAHATSTSAAPVNPEDLEHTPSQHHLMTFMYRQSLWVKMRIMARVLVFGPGWARHSLEKPGKDQGTHRDAAQVPQEGGAGHEELPEAQERPGVQFGRHIEKAEYAPVRRAADARLHLRPRLGSRVRVWSGISSSVNTCVRRFSVCTALLLRRHDTVSRHMSSTGETVQASGCLSTLLRTGILRELGMRRNSE